MCDDEDIKAIPGNKAMQTPARKEFLRRVAKWGALLCEEKSWAMQFEELASIYVHARTNTHVHARFILYRHTCVLDSLFGEQVAQG